LVSGKAFQKFKEIIEAQQGKIRDFPDGKFKFDVFAEKNGKIQKIYNKKLIFLSRTLGCPLDKSAGLYLYEHVGAKVKKGQKLITLYSDSEIRINEARKFYKDSNPIIII
jgi:thymidine phosphorylase